MPKQQYAGELLWAYQKGFDKGKADDRAERGLMNFGGMFAGDAQTARNVEAWRDGFEDGQRTLGLDPAKTYCSKQEYPGAQGPELRRQAEAQAAATVPADRRPPADVRPGAGYGARRRRA